MSGEDMRHSWVTEDDVRALVDSRVIDGEGRIIETDTGHDPDDALPVNVIGGNNAD